ncbi:MAG: hypothetical protein FWD98_06220, partial [Defluviitaleaceae bacterium]|nr:hypothetical protein [Defluviitaleaceae bacterium]
MKLLKTAAVAVGLAALITVGAAAAVLTVFPLRHAELIEKHAEINGLDPVLIAAVIHAESK